MTVKLSNVFVDPNNHYVYFVKTSEGLLVNQFNSNHNCIHAWSRVRGDITQYCHSRHYLFRTYKGNRFDMWVTDLNMLNHCWVYSTRHNSFTNPFTKNTLNLQEFKSQYEVRKAD